MNKVDELLENVLNMSCENVKIILRLLIQCKAKKSEQLKYSEKLFIDSKNYEKIIRFGDDLIKNEVNRYLILLMIDKS